MIRHRLAAGLGIALLLKVALFSQDITTGLIGRYPLDGTGQDLSQQNNPLVLRNVQPATDRNGNSGCAVDQEIW